MHKLSVVVLAAGEGKRMKSKNSKVVFEVCQKPIINWVLDAALGAGATFATVVVGHREDQVRAAVGDGATFVTQTEQLGTAHALMQARATIEGCENVLVLAGDTPLICADTLREAFEAHIAQENAMTVITTLVRDSSGYGRIVRNQSGEVDKIVEEKDATETQRKILEINSGMYVFESKALLEAIDKVGNDNAQGEYYLTDVLAIMRDCGSRVGAYTAADSLQISGVNNRVQLAEADGEMRRRINTAHLLNGVTIMNIDDTYIAPTVTIGRDSVIYPGTILSGETHIGEDVTIGPSCRMVNATIGDGVDAYFSTVIDSAVGAHTHLGPYAYLRPGCNVGESCRIGDFVELKNATIGDGTKVSHLTYLGDVKVGKKVNFGCGTVTANYDGKKKYTSVIGDGCFIGCNTNLISPVVVEDGAFIAAGSTITKDVPSQTLAIARSRQSILTSWTDPRKND